jgi:hypothetical protein
MCCECRIRCKLGLRSLECYDDESEFAKPSYLLVQAALLARRLPMDIIKHVIFPFLPKCAEEAAVDGDAYLLKCLLTHVHRLRKTRCLVLASALGHVETVKVLLACGASVNDGWYTSASFGHFETSIFDQMNCHFGHQYALPTATWNNQIEVAKELLKAKADVNINGGQALCSAVSCDKIELVNFLLSANADVHVRNDMPLRLAAHYGLLSIVNKLREFGANVHAHGDDF